MFILFASQKRNYGSRWMWTTMWCGFVVLILSFSLQTPRPIDIGGGFILSELPMPAGKDRESEQSQNPLRLGWALCYMTHPDIGAADVLVKDVREYSPPISGKVCGRSGSGYFVASAYSVVNPEESLRLYQDQAAWRLHVESLAESEHIKLVAPDRRQASGFGKAEGVIVAGGVVGLVVIALVTRKK